MRCTAALLLSLAAGAGAFLVPPSPRVCVLVCDDRGRGRINRRRSVCHQ